MRKLDFFWRSNKEWYHITEDGHFVINADAPKEAQESYKHYLEQHKQNKNKTT